MADKKYIHQITRTVLFPFAILFDTITKSRNHLYQSGIKKSIHFESVVINVGNLTVGGTGKTPHVEYLIRLLKEHYKLATLSRGYGRKTKGFILAGESATADEIGDEPMQFYSKFSNDIIVTVGEERILAIPEIISRYPETDVIILDDAFQHRKVQPDLNILLCDYNLPFYEDFLLPAGRLRESRKGADRADIIVVSKCPPQLDWQSKIQIEKFIRKYAKPGTPIYFTTIKYADPIAVYDQAEAFNGKVLLVSGIARSGDLEVFVKERYNFYKHLKFKDHHHYSKEDLLLIREEFEKINEKDKVILITEKDMVKWRKAEFNEIFKNVPVFYLPIQIGFLADGQNFDQRILTKIKERLNELESR